ncbi:hypothetical protein D1872_315570 [compost metagenome]
MEMKNNPTILKDVQPSDDALERAYSRVPAQVAARTKPTISNLIGFPLGGSLMSNHTSRMASSPNGTQAMKRNLQLNHSIR